MFLVSIQIQEVNIPFNGISNLDGYIVQKPLKIYDLKRIIYW